MMAWSKRQRSDRPHVVWASEGRAGRRRSQGLRCNRRGSLEQGREAT
jgi:hypothetical protein